MEIVITCAMCAHAAYQQLALTLFRITVSVFKFAPSGIMAVFFECTLTVGVLLAISVYACMRSFCVLLLFQCRPATNDAVIAAKDSQIASLQAALMEKDRILQNISRVRAGFAINFTDNIMPILLYV